MYIMFVVKIGNASLCFVYSSLRINLLTVLSN